MACTKCGRYGCGVKLLIFKIISRIYILSSSSEIATGEYQHEHSDD